MTDDRDRSSSSEDLLREARRRVHDGDLYSDDHLADPQVESDSLDDYGGDSTPDDDDGLSAVEIAERLAESLEAEAPADQQAEVSPEPDVPEADKRANVGMSSLPAWALDDDPTTTGPSETADEFAAPPVSLSERIRSLSDQQEQHGEVVNQPLQTPPPPGGERDPWSTPSEEWQSRTESAPRRKSTVSWIKPVASMIAIAVFGFGFVASQLDGTEAIDQLAVGQCFNPGTATEVYSVPVVDCDELHEAELYGTVEIDAFGANFPGDDAMYEWVNARCEDQFPAYVGEPYAESRYWIEVFTPTESGWDDGDRTGLCTVVLVDENLNIRPALGTARNWGSST